MNSVKQMMEKNLGFNGMQDNFQCTCSAVLDEVPEFFEILSSNNHPEVIAVNRRDNLVVDVEGDCRMIVDQVLDVTNFYFVFEGDRLHNVC